MYTVVPEIFSKHFTSVNLFSVYKQIDTQCIYYYSIMFHTRVQVLNFSLSTASQVVLVVKNPPANAGDRAADLIPGSERSPGGGHGNPLQYFFLENPMDRGAWRATVHRVSKSQT